MPPRTADPDDLPVIPDDDDEDLLADLTRKLPGVPLDPDAVRPARREEDDDVGGIRIDPET